MNRACVAVFTVMASTASVAFAQDRPSESEMFGGSSSESPPADSAPKSPNEKAEPTPTAASPAVVTPETTPTPALPPSKGASEANTSASGVDAPPKGNAESTRDTQILGTTETPMFTEETAPEDPLKVGSQLYLRTQSTASQDQNFTDFSFSAPSLVDLYLDARPNDRVRGFVLGRMAYDPTLPASASSPSTSGQALSATGSTAGSASLSSLFQQQTRDPKVYLDQLWLRFDIARRVFVTAGKQHVRWGTARFWAPTDYLHLRPRNPLDVFDARTGTTMLKLHLPIESKGWNFYAYGLTEGPDATSTLGRLGGAARAEFVIDTTEVGLGAMVQKGRKPKYAIDLSTGISDFDFYGEMALRYQDDIDRVRYDANATSPALPADPPTNLIPYIDTNQARTAYYAQVADAYYPTYRRQGIRPQAVGGVNYSRKYNDNDTFTLGAEYFYNPLGYNSPINYPGLVLPHSVPLHDSANFFYLGRHYAALYITFPAPYSLDNHTFTLSTIGNLSDKSFITRFDYSLIALTHIRFEAFVSGRYGNENGEFRFGIRSLQLGNLAPISRAAAFMDFGLALRVAI